MADTILEEYWSGVLQRLEAEVAILAKLIAHQGERGRENESALARVLESFVPKRYGIGTGLLIDAHGRYSRQTDIVVFEQSDEPAVLAQTTQLLFPIENVLATVEVKTTLRADAIRACGVNRTSQCDLEPVRNYPDTSSHPLFIVLAYTADMRPELVLANFQKLGAEERPHLVCVLDQALLIGRPGIIRTTSGDDLVGGVALRRGLSGAPIVGIPQGPDMRQSHEGRIYPIVSLKDQLVLVDPGRALLLFVEALVRGMADQQERVPPVLSAYLPDETRELAWL